MIRSRGRETPLDAGLKDVHLMLDGAIISASSVNVTTLTLTNGAVLTHAGAGLTNESRLHINAGTLTISTNSRIDVSTRGYLGGLSGANSGNQSGRTFGNTVEGGSTRRNGGSYGGMGAVGGTEETVNSSYGSFSDPDELGSGGGSDSGPAGTGGGRVRINAGSLALDGQILANGGDAGYVAGAGSGGAIKITVDSLTGGGLISANGGSADPSYAGSGGGGRIAIYSGTITQSILDLVQALGGANGLRVGSPGTLYLQNPASPKGRLLVDARGTTPPSRATQIFSVGGGAGTALAANVLIDADAAFPPGGLVGLRLNPNTSQSVTFEIIANSSTNIITAPLDGDMTRVASAGALYSATPTVGHFAIQGGAIVELLDADASLPNRSGRLRVITSDILGGSVLTHPATTTTAQFGLELVVDDRLLIDAASRVDVNGLGYLGTRNGGHNDQTGRTLGNTTKDGSTRRNGGSHGGSGGFGDVPGFVGVPYDDAQAPVQPGAGGGSDSGPAGNGGGVIRLYVGALQVQGNISANGANGTRYGGGGAGGAIWINTRTLSGNGIIHAEGRDGGAESGGGGGGRIAIYFQDASAFDFAGVSTLGGLGFSPGGKGTLYQLQTNFVPPAAPSGSAPPPPVIYEIQVSGVDKLNTPRTADGASSGQVVVRWLGETGREFMLETSQDLLRWTPTAVIAKEISTGRYQALTTGRIAEQGFFRVRRVD